MSATGVGNLDAASVAATELFADYAATIYAAQARLAMARLYMDKGRDQDAADVLRVLVESGGDNEIQLIGRLRLAKVLLYQDKAEEVVDLLQGQGEHAFAARYSEVLGDAYTALGSYAEAEAAYTVALDDDLNRWEKLASNPITPKTSPDDPHHDKYRSWDPFGWLEGNTYYAIFGGQRPAIAKSDSLQGEFLLVHGMGDDNVHFQNSVDFTEALVQAGKQFRQLSQLCPPQWQFSSAMILARI